MLQAPAILKARTSTNPTQPTVFGEAIKLLNGFRAKYDLGILAGTGWYERPSHPVPNMTYGTGIEVSGSEKKAPRRREGNHGAGCLICSSDFDRVGDNIPVRSL